MINTDLIRDLRVLTQAGMKDCKEALIESNWDLQKAVDIIKAKGKNITSSNKIAAEGRVINSFVESDRTVQMIEVNCVTDFVANSKEFLQFCEFAKNSLSKHVTDNIAWKPAECAELEDARKNLISITKENIEIRRWWVEQLCAEGRVFSYVHPSGNCGKIGVILSLSTDDPNVSVNKEFVALGNDLAMQVAAMNPLVVSSDRLDVDTINRQKAIFTQQITGLNKPAAAQEKIMEGKMNKWHTEVCLLNQESVVKPKTTIAQLINNLANKLSCNISVVNFIRCQVGEGLSVGKENFADEAIKMVIQ